MLIARSFAFAAAVAVALAAAPAYAQVRWTLPSAYPANNFHVENLGAFAKEVADATGGKLAITVHPNAALFKATEIKSAVRIGQAQLGELLISLHENEDPVFGIDVVPLFAVPWPPQGIYSRREINRVGDMKGLSWRVYNAGTQRIAEIVGAYAVTIQAADLPQALSTGLINAFMTSSATGYDSKAWEHMTYFYDAQAWIPKNVTLVNKAAFDGLEAPVRQALLNAAAAAEARGWKASEEKTKWYTDQLAARGMNVQPPSPTLKLELQQVGEQLTGEWLKKTGAEGQAVIGAYKSKNM